MSGIDSAMDVPLTQEQVEILRNNLYGDGTHIMSDDQINKMVSLLQMLNDANPSEWDYDKCDQFAAAIITLVNNSSNPNEIKTEIDNLLIEMAGKAGAPIKSNTVLKVEFYRKLFLRLLGLGMSFTALQMIAPGRVSLILDYAYSFFKTLLSEGFNPEDIAATTASSSPFSAGSFASSARNVASGAANLAATASSSLVGAAFSACAQVAGICLNAVNNAVCLAFNTDTLAFASHVAAATAATKAAEKTADILKPSVENTIGFFMGKFDNAAADYFDKGGFNKDFNSVINMGEEAYNLGRTTGIAAIETALNDMSEINSKYATVDVTWVQNRYIAPSINKIISEKIGENVISSARKYRTHLGELISQLSTIKFGSADENGDIDRVANYFDVKSDEVKYQNFMKLISLWKLYTHRKNLSDRSVSLNRGLDGYKPEGKITRTFSAIDPIVTVKGAKEYYSKPFKKINAIENSDSVFDFVTESNVNLNKKLLEVLNNNGIITENNDGWFQKLGQLTEDEQKKMIKVINNVQTLPANAFTIQEIEYNKGENTRRILAAIKENFNKGGRRIKSTKAKKSRHNNKKRSTIKRKKARQMARKTRKGKKKRYTQKRR